MFQRMTTAAALLIGLTCPLASGHELWFQPADAKAPGEVRLTFGDSPAPGEAERVAEIAHAKVWSGGRPVDVDRKPDGLVARVPADRSGVLTAYADRGVVESQGDAFIITLAAYAQSKPEARPDDLKLGLDDDQLRLLLVEREGGKPVVKATWKGKPVADLPVKLFRGPAGATELRTDARGEVACPDRTSAGVSLLAQVVDKAAGKRDGKPYSETRRKATLRLEAEAVAK